MDVGQGFGEITKRKMYKELQRTGHCGKLGSLIF